MFRYEIIFVRGMRFQSRSSQWMEVYRGSIGTDVRVREARTWASSAPVKVATGARGSPGTIV